jgi:hypothetical protein
MTPPFGVSETRKPLPPIPVGDTHRLNLARRCRRMRDAGATYREVARRVGISRSYASSLCRDPTGEQDRARKDRYSGTCLDCGSPTDGSNGRESAPKRCVHCSPRVAALWTPETCLDALRDFYAEHGRAPTPGERGAGSAANAEVERVDWLPWYETLRRCFGTAADAMRAAGIPPRPQGQYARPSRVQVGRKAG